MFSIKFMIASSFVNGSLIYDLYKGKREYTKKMLWLMALNDIKLIGKCVTWKGLSPG
jgi:hypothetical protein